MAKHDALFLDADPTSGLPTYSASELRGLLTGLQPGVLSPASFKVTAGSGLTVDSAAGAAAINPSFGTSQGFYYVVDDASENSATFERTGGGTGIPANASTNPRLDAVVVHVYDHSLDGSGRRAWVREYVPGTPASGATLGGSLPSLPPSSLLIAEVLTPASNPTTIPSANIRDRRPWAKSAYRRILRNSGDYTTASTAPINIDSANLSPRLELSGCPCRVTLRGGSSSTAGAVWFYLLDNGTVIDGFTDGLPRRNTGTENTSISWDWVPSAGSHVITPQWQVGTGTATFKASPTSPLELVVEEIARPSADNT